MAKKVDLTGKTIGYLTVVREVSPLPVGKDKKPKRLWECRCVCGKLTCVLQEVLIQGATRSCGCKRFELISASKRKYLPVGSRFGKLTVERLDDEATAETKLTTYVCRCDCGVSVSVPRKRLLNGHTKSCGCLSVELSSQRKGPKSPSWKPELSEADRELRIRRHITSENVNVRTAVFTRDAYTCKKCGKTNCYLNAHHILPWATHPGDRYKMDNVVTLCSSCHKQIHRMIRNLQGVSPATTFANWLNEKGTV